MVPVVSGGLAAVLAVAVIAIAFGTTPPALGVAEFAPSAARAVDPPPTTSADDRSDGAGRNANAGGRGPAGTTTTAQPAEGGSTDTVNAGVPKATVARTRLCSGSPPRQTEDPMSPPCVATIFAGDNGGATSTGVSGNEIRVAIPVDSRHDDAGTQPEAWRLGLTAMFEYFNQRYEFYGRRLVPVPVKPTTGGAWDPTMSRTVGAEAAGQKVFGAVTTWMEAWGTAPQASLASELARNRIITIARNAGLGWSDRVVFDPLHPYVWSVYPSAEENLAALGEFACSLAGHPARFSLDTSSQGQTRKFGVVAYGSEVVPPTRALTERLEQCGVEPIVVGGVSRTDPGGSALRTSFERLRAGGVTTIVCACESATGFSPVVTSADDMGYKPEWLLGSSNMYSEEAPPQWYWTSRNRNLSVMRAEPGPKLIPVQSRPWFQALLETNPKLATDPSMSQTFQIAFQIVPVLYEGLRVLAAGIQAAGPLLTPETFAAALQSLQFPNPGAGQAPYWQPSAGFGPGDHSFYDDYALSWWSASAPSVDPYFPLPFGSWCYVNQGARYRVGGFPRDADAALFDANRPCR